jgi:hypothetical protein
MKNLITQAVIIFEHDLDFLNSQNEYPVKKAKAAIAIHNRCLTTLKSIVTSGTFESSADEIEFFKNTKPYVLGAKLFYLKLIHTESRKPLAMDLWELFYIGEIKSVQSTMNKDIDFYSYILSGKTHLDEHYFIRGCAFDEWDYDVALLSNDPLFSTGYDIKVAIMMANKRFVEFLSNALADIRKQLNDPTLGTQVPNWKWTETKAALVELIYALHATPCINHGRAELKDIASFFESVFQTNLGDIYHNFTQLKERNKPTKFIDMLKTGLTQKMEEQNNVFQ